LVNQARQTNEAHLSVRRGVSPSCDQTSCQAGQCLPFEFPQRERGGSEAEQRQTNPAKNGNDGKKKKKKTQSGEKAGKSQAARKGGRARESENQKEHKGFASRDHRLLCQVAAGDATRSLLQLPCGVSTFCRRLIVVRGR